MADTENRHALTCGEFTAIALGLFAQDNATRAATSAPPLYFYSNMLDSAWESYKVTAETSLRHIPEGSVAPNNHIVMVGTALRAGGVNLYGGY